MSDSAGARFIKENWWLVLGFVLAIAGVVVLSLRDEDAEDTSAGADRPSRSAESIRTPTLRPETPESEAKEHIAEYEAELEADPEHELTAPRLQAAGNLYKTKLRDYEAAAFKYQTLLTEHPEYEMNQAVYFDLEVCFNELGDEAGLRWLYELIIEREPADSNEVEYAKVQLGAISLDEAMEVREEREAAVAAERASALAGEAEEASDELTEDADETENEAPPEIAPTQE